MSSAINKPQETNFQPHKIQNIKDKENSKSF